MSLPNNRCRVVLLVEELRLTTWGYPVIPWFTWFYNVLYISGGARFLNHQQYETIQPTTSTFRRTMWRRVTMAASSCPFLKFWSPWNWIHREHVFFLGPFKRGIYIHYIPTKYKVYIGLIIKGLLPQEYHHFKPIFRNLWSKWVGGEFLHAFPTLAALVFQVNQGWDALSGSGWWNQISKPLIPQKSSPVQRSHFIVIEKNHDPSPPVNLPIHLRRRFMDQNTEKRIENPYIPMAFEVPTKGETPFQRRVDSHWFFPVHGVRYFWFGTNIGETLVLNDVLKSGFFLGGLGCFLLGIGCLGQGRVVIHGVAGVAKTLPMRVSHGPALIPSMKNMTLIYIDNQRSTAEKYWSNNRNLDVPGSNSV